MSKKTKSPYLLRELPKMKKWSPHPPAIAISSAWDGHVFFEILPRKLEIRSSPSNAHKNSRILPRK
jgi:hypothetical protein